jgi:hypothetical protein
VVDYATRVERSAGGGEGPPPCISAQRVYTTHPGKREALHRRFRDHTCRLFQRHGMARVRFWTPIDAAGENTLVYLFAFPDRAAREAAWAAYDADPEAQRVRAESKRNGPLARSVESTLLDPTDYSPLR